MRIVIAEDSAVDAMLIREALDASRVQADLVVCPDGGQMRDLVERIAAGEEPCPDVFMLDLNLPKYTGAEILHRIRTTQICEGVPVIIVTSSDAPQDRDIAVKLGATDYFRKSSDLDEFLRLGDVVRSLIEPPAAN